MDKMSYSYFENNDIYDPITAAVGNNGNPTIDCYAEGYFESVRFMICEILQRIRLRKNPESYKIDSKGIRIVEDILVYPICFNIRHSIELYLKAIIQKIVMVYKIKEIAIPRSWKDNHHDILLLWKLIFSCSLNNWGQDSNVDRKNVFDERFDDYLSKLNEYITQWGTIDRTGQTFRYPLDTESKRHLKDVSNISILYMFRYAECNHKILKEFYDFLQDLYDDYKVNRGNKFLTYYQLTELAKLLPAYKDWKKLLTADLRDNLKMKFKLQSNRQISQCIDYIKEDYYLSSLISKDIPFKNISIGKIKEIIEFFCKFQIDDFVCFNSEELDLSNLSSLIESSIKDFKLIEEFFLEYSFKELIDLITLIYIGRDNEKPQIYDLFYKNMSKMFENRESIIRKLQEKRGNIAIYLKEVLNVFGKSLLCESKL